MVFKVNTYMAFSDDKIGISILVHNHLGIPLLAKAIPRMGCFKISYGELVAIIEGYVAGSTQGDCVIIESDSLVAIKSLHSNDEYFSELGALSSDFRNSIDKFSTCL